MHPLHLYETVVLIAGGVGIAPALSYLQDYGHRRANQTTRTTRIVFACTAKEAFLLQSIYAALEVPNGAEIRLYHTGQDDKTNQHIHGRPDLEALVEEQVSALEDGRIAFFVSGPGGMSDVVRKAVVGSVGDRVPAGRLQFFDEIFAW